MAKNVDINYTGKFNLPIPIGRLNPTPADATEVWDSLANAQNYAVTSPVAWVGQHLFVKENNKHYWIANEAGELTEISANTADRTMIRGFYYEGEFYTSSEHTEIIAKSLDKVYVDNPTGVIYTYSLDQAKYKPCAQIQAASATEAGVMKLYEDKGENTDGTITQKTTTDLSKEIKFSIKDDDDECLLLSNPWSNN